MKMNKLMNKDIKPLYEGLRAGDIKHSYADISLAGKSIAINRLFHLKKLKKNQLTVI
ncbi:MAG: hypothetical protein R3A12_04105 [Ignavibacteria bacterium]